MTEFERAAFLAQFEAARREMQALAKTFPAYFDANGRAIVAELRFAAIAQQRGSGEGGAA